MSGKDALRQELLSILNGFCFEENWKSRNREVTLKDISELNTRFYNEGIIKEEIYSMKKVGLIDIEEDKTSGDTIENIKLTPEGEDQARDLVEIYWPKNDYWKTKYPNLVKELIPELNENDDWEILELLAEKISYLDAYTIDRSVAEGIVKSKKPPQAFGRFISKIYNRRNSIPFYINHRTKPEGGSVEILKLNPPIKLLLEKDGHAVMNTLKTVKKHFDVLAKMYSDSQTKQFKKHEFFELFFQCGGKKTVEVEVLLKSFGNVELIEFHPVTYSDNMVSEYQIMLNSIFGSKYYEEWEHEFLINRLNPQSQLYFHLTQGSDVIHDKKTKRFALLESFTAKNRLDFPQVLDPYRKEVKEQKEDMNKNTTNSNVFIVHGHDKSLRESVARFIEKLGLKPIILDEEPNISMTIVEKIEEKSDVGYAIVLLTPDDNSFDVNEKETKRARQNVILELGYFWGKLGRGKFCVLHKGDIELPSDVQGILYIKADEHDGWKQRLLRELKAAKLEFDANKIFE